MVISDVDALLNAVDVVTLAGAAMLANAAVMIINAVNTANTTNVAKKNVVVNAIQ